MASVPRLLPRQWQLRGGAERGPELYGHQAVGISVRRSDIASAASQVGAGPCVCPMALSLLGGAPLPTFHSIAYREA